MAAGVAPDVAPGVAGPPAAPALVVAADPCPTRPVALAFESVAPALVDGCPGWLPGLAFVVAADGVGGAPAERGAGREELGWGADRASVWGGAAFVGVGAGGAFAARVTGLVADGGPY